MVELLKLNDMKSKIFLLAASFLIAFGMKAQKGVDTGTPFGSGDDSIQCRTNISLFTPYAKSGNFKDAQPFWKKAYDECPASTKNIYIYGIDIINWQISQETDPAKKDALIDEMMTLFDNRVKYFGDDPKYGKDWIVARKAAEYNKLKGENTDPKLVYQWTGEVIDELKEKVDPSAISLYMFASFKMMQNDKDTYKGQYVDDFLKCSALLDEAYAAAKAANNEKDAEGLMARKVEIEKNFTTSGAADCETLQSIYTPKVEENKDNIEFLKETMTLLRRVGCKESDIFITTSVYAHAIEPTAESAMGLGTKAIKDKDYAGAEKYFSEAIEMTEDSDTKGDLYYALAAMAIQQNQYTKTKQYAQKCLAEKPNYCNAYILLATAYAAGGRGIYSDDPVLSKIVYCVVVDKLERARQLDPSCADEANRLIATYRKHFPTKEEVFMHPDIKEGENFTVGGWIGETTKIRTAQ